MEQLNVGLGDRSYPIWIGNGIMTRLGEALVEVKFPRRVAIVTNSTVSGFYREPVLDALSLSGFQASVIEIPEGEQFKTLQTLELIYDSLIRGGFDRYCGLLALGGGVVGDITGFAAATYLRGVPFAQIPTTLLSQVDSSVGGKTAVNHPLGKNMIGAFYQPRHVHIDVATLRTLPRREFAAGMAEVIKYGVIRDRDFFCWLAEQKNQLLDLVPDALIQAVKRSCQIKANVVEIDEKESSLRAILNYGHTFGHAVETLAGYGVICHGEAVAIGMVIAAELSMELGFASQEDVGAIRSLITEFGLPTTPPAHPLDDYLAAMGRDKKVRDGMLRFVLNHGIGDCSMHDIRSPESLFARILSQYPGIQVK
ncbi:MAG: 3-dehydroquinate synthase [Desulfuromonadaceae bacterium GWC2_58_13]|nr:MAG: 3-dehydroquinate synthase [Desulfuromonadaceae bacterium GWC2_58_13]